MAIRRRPVSRPHEVSRSELSQRIHRPDRWRRHFCWKTDLTRSSGFRKTVDESDARLTVSFNEKTTFTAGDRSIVVRSAGRRVVELVEGESLDGPHTELVGEAGLRAQLRAPGGGLVQSDAGNLRFLATFDENGEDIDLQILKDAGHHEQFQSDVFCNAALPLLGIATA